MSGIEPNFQLVQDAKKCKYSLIPSSLAVEDVLQVWHQVCNFVTRQLLQNKAVNITGLGLFSVLFRKLDMGPDRKICVQRPIFVLSEKFAKTHALSYTKYQSPGEIPVIQLNLAAIAMEMSLERDVVDLCIRELVNAFSRSVNTGKQANLGFKDIGQLVIKEGKAKMKFFKEFLRTVDGSNSSFSTPHLLRRLNTMDSIISRSSVMTSASLLRPNTYMLPSAANRNIWVNPTESECPERPPSVISNTGGSLTLAPLETVEETRKLDIKCGTASSICPPSTSMTTWTNDVLAYDGGMELQRVKEDAAKLNKPDIKPAVICETNDVEALVSEKPSAPLPATVVPAETTEMAADDNSTSLPELTSNCHHTGGQELCYPCHQRRRRNIPISYEVEKQRAELELEKTLTQYQISKDNEYWDQEQRYAMRDRELSKEVAECNLQLAEKVRQEKKPDRSFHESYLFSRRPPVPLPKMFLTQQQYSNFLDGQVKLKTDREEKERIETEILEKNEQKYLKEEISRARQREIVEKAAGIKTYQAALDAQLANQPYRFPPAVSDSDGPIFGKCDINPTKMKEMRKRYKEVMEHQLRTVEEKRNAQEVERSETAKFDLNVMARAKSEALEESYKKYQMRRAVRSDLEKTWKSQHSTKKSRVADELKHRKQSGLLLLDQCDKYKRCEQCKKCYDNVGTSNLWRETRYMAGARLMI